MKTKNLVLACLLLVAGTFMNPVAAQDITVAEPDTAAADLLYLVTSDNQLKALPMETGEIKEHKNKLGKFASIAGGIASAAGSLGSLGAIVGAQAGSFSGLITGIRVAGAASNVANLADVADQLAGAEGHDFTYEGPTSKTSLKLDGKDINLLANVRVEKKEDALTLFKVVKFKSTKNDRRLRWFQTKAALINTEKEDEANKAGYLSYGYKSYGDHCSLLTIPAKNLTKGEYGVYFLGNMFGPSLAILCYTFSLE